MTGRLDEREAGWIVLPRTFRMPRDEVWKAVTEPKRLERWIGTSRWVRFLAEDPRCRSSTSVCLKIVDPGVDQAKTAGGIATLLEAEGIAFDIGSYRDAPPGLRIWCGATVEQADVEALTLWLDWAFAEIARRG